MLGLNVVGSVLKIGRNVNKMKHLSRGLSDFAKHRVKCSLIKTTTIQINKLVDGVSKPPGSLIS